MRSTAPVTSDLIEPLVVVGLYGLNQLGQGAAVVGVNRGDGDTGGGLPSANSSETRFVLDNAVWDSHLSAQSWKEHDHLNGIHIIGDDHQLSFLLLNEGGDGVDAVSHDWSSLARGVILALSSSGSTLPQPLLLGVLGLGSVLVQQLAQLGSCLTIQGRVELVDCWWDPQSGLKDNLLSLKTDVLGPSDESAQISLGLDVLSDTEVPGSLLEQRIDDSLDFLPLDGQRGGGHLLSLPLLAFLIDHLALGYEYNLL